MDHYAHSLLGRPDVDWEPLGDHLRAVGDRAAGFASAFGWDAAAGTAGLLHDIGKISDRFQAYIQAAPAAAGTELVRGGDHSAAGARIAVERYGLFGRLLAFGMAGHHAGLADGDDLDRHLVLKQRALPPYQGWEMPLSRCTPRSRA